MVDEFSTDSRHRRGRPVKDMRGELCGHVEIFGDNLNPAISYVRDRAIARQRANPKLNLCCALKGATFALAPISKHPTHPLLVDLVFRQSYRKPIGLRLNEPRAIDRF